MNKKLKDLLKHGPLFKLYKRFIHVCMSERKDFNSLYRNSLKIVKNYSHNSICNESLEKKIIVSLTTYPKRIKSAGIAIASIMNQTYKANKIVLTLNESQFPNHKFPKIINEEIKAGLEILWIKDDLKPHNKYFYAMKKYPNDIIITIDDDEVYQQDLIESLITSYKKHPKSVSCMLARKITIQNDKILPYVTWTMDTPENIPSTQLIALGIGGVLYPPNIINKELFNTNKIKKLGLKADDLWLKIMQIITNPPVKVVKAGKFITGNQVPTSQLTNLMGNNVYGGENDIQFHNIINEYNTFASSPSSIIKRLQDKNLDEVRSQQPL